MKRLLLIFSLLVMLAVSAVNAENVTGNSTFEVNTTLNGTALSGSINVIQVNMTVNATATPTPTPTPAPVMNETVNQTASNTAVNESISTDELIKILQKQLEDQKKQIEVLTEEIKKLREENARLKEELAKLRKRPITWEDVEQTVDEYYIQFVYWTGWLWPMLTFYMIYRYRKPAREEEAERIQEAVEKLTKEKQREWYSFQIRKRGIEAVAEDETELAIFRALGIYTIGDLLNRSESELIEAFKSKYHPTADLLEHFKNRLKEIREQLKTEVESGGEGDA